MQLALLLATGLGVSLPQEVLLLQKVLLLMQLVVQPFMQNKAISTLQVK